MAVFAQINTSAPRFKELQAELRLRLKGGRGPSADIGSLSPGFDWLSCPGKPQSRDDNINRWPSFIFCGLAYPHTDWDSYFIGVSLLGERSFGEIVPDPDHPNSNPGGAISRTHLSPGYLFVVDGSRPHWLEAIDETIPRGWWGCVQWEVSKDSSVEHQASMLRGIAEIFGLGSEELTAPKSRGLSDERYAPWVELIRQKVVCA